MTTLTLCQSCPAGQTPLAARLGDAIAAAGLPVTIAGVECMSGCARPSTLACRATGKTAYLFGDITEADLNDILTFLRLYLQSPDGNFADARLLGALRLKALARIPG
ncbi:DUF1636 domain-containing protein [Pseudorhodobacter sp. E13]|uniref:DUF1636 domain-containing protein n=1 Tax=Pseudorhodobacter sp. E13 TaxID=2487931 RepID=UPI000F8EB599|nr:DUF1636 domain-containing protein [Pseudorhodobacter sp. E13]RUS63308.1 DUF1636 domain-containing protein [Pseudorhodobacter sp. E13]